MSLAASYAKTPVATIVSEAKGALDGLKSVHIVSDGNQNGREFGFSLSLDQAGHCVGTITIDHATFSVLGVPGGQFFMMADQTNWVRLLVKQGKSAAAAQAFGQLAGGKWLSGVGDPTNGLCSLRKGTNDIGKSVKGRKVLGTAVVGGTPGVKVTVTSSGKQGTMIVSAAAPHYPLQFVVPTFHETETLSEFDKTVATKAPTNAIDIHSLQS